MSRTTTIQWAHHRFNPWAGCAKVHAGCAHCYAEALPPKMRRSAPWGEVYAGGQRVMAPEGYWANPVAWARSAAREGERHRVFCASTADVLEVPKDAPASMGLRRLAAQQAVEQARKEMNRARLRLWGLIEDTAYPCPRGGTEEGCSCKSHGVVEPGLDWLLLTKRPENWHLVPEAVRPLVWLGTSVSDQDTLDKWGSRLMRAEGFGVRFLSVEPLLGPVDLSPLLDPVGSFCCGGEPEFCHCLDGWQYTPDGLSYVRPDWVIVGGESGRKARQCQVEWVRDLVRQCRRAGVPVFVKQLGAHYVDTENAVGGVLAQPPPEYGALHRRLADTKGGDMAEWPEDLRVRELPEVHRE